MTTPPRITADRDPKLRESALTAETLQQWCEQTMPEPDLDARCRQILEHMVTTVGASRASLMVINPATGRLMIRAAVGLPPEWVGHDVEPRPRSISQWVFRNRRGLVLNGEVRDQRFETTSQGEIESAMSVPLATARGSLGVLNLARYSPAPTFSDPELQNLQDASAPLAATLERLLDADCAERARHQLTDGGGSLLRTVPAGGSDVRDYLMAFAHRPSLRVAGDLCERVSHPNGSHSLLVADVCGDGVDAVTTAAFVQGLFVASATGDRRPQAVLVRMASDLGSRLRSGALVSAWTGSLTPSGQLTSCSAGFPAPLWITAEGGECHPLASGGPPLGAIADANYEEESVRLFPGDTVVVASNGIFQARGVSDQPFGVDRLIELLSEHRRQSVERMVGIIVDTVVEYSGNSVPADDLTVLAFRFSRDD